MTTEPQQPTKNQSVKAQLEERKKQIQESSPNTTELTPQQRIEKSDGEIKAFLKEQELESVKLGYIDFKTRESSISSREQSLKDGQDKLKKDIGEFELEQKKRMETHNKNVEEYNKSFKILQTTKEESNRIMAEAIAKKAEADNIIKHQTETERINQEKQEAYAENMEESLKLVSDIIRILRRQDDSKILSLAVVLNKDLNLIQWLQYKKAGLQTIADIISVECDRIVELCEYLQNSKKDYSDIFRYLMDCTEWLQKALKIEWNKG